MTAWSRSSGRKARAAAGLAAALAAALAAGCAGLPAPVGEIPEAAGYYWQSVRGHLSVVGQARPIPDVLADPATDARLRGRLERVAAIRAFASASLALPDNGSYTRYADLGRPFVVWNVFATPELSVKLRQWCFPVAGCVSYRGYYSREDAEAYAQGLRGQGFQAFVAGVPAYSTLGWFDDPVLNTFVHYPDAELARLVFHELAHQVLYLKGDTEFSESFATAVEQVGVERWLAEQEARTGDARLRHAWEAWRERRAGFVALILRHRAALEALYASDRTDDEKRAGRDRVFAELRSDYEALKASWGGFAGYDRWFAQPLTNAHLASVASYSALVPAFRALLDEQGGDLPKFFDAARRVAALPKPERDARLAALAPARNGVVAASRQGSAE